MHAIKNRARVVATTDMGISIFVKSDHNFSGAVRLIIYSLVPFVSSYLRLLMDFSYGFNYL